MTHGRLVGGSVTAVGRGNGKVVGGADGNTGSVTIGPGTPGGPGGPGGPGDPCAGVGEPPTVVPDPPAPPPGRVVAVGGVVDGDHGGAVRVVGYSPGATRAATIVPARMPPASAMLPAASRISRAPTPANQRRATCRPPRASIRAP